MFSIAYIANDIWSDFKTEQINDALQSGYKQEVAATVNQAMAQAENKECKAFSIYTKDKSVEVINTKCLQTATENGPAQKKVSIICYLNLQKEHQKTFCTNFSIEFL